MASTKGAFSWLTAGIAAALLLPVLSMTGMFMDGMLYSVVAHNQANGFGSFWFPRFSQTGLAGLQTFHEHPPLTFGIQAVWFKIFGSAFWVERAYSVFTAIITGTLITFIWRSWTLTRPVERKLAWFPILLWIIIPTVHWCIHNNMMENTMGIFTTAAILLVVLSRDRWFALHVVAGMLVFLASMAKGLPGLFPLAAPLIIAGVLRTGAVRGIVASLVMSVTVATCYALTFLDTNAREALSIHIDQRLLHRIAEVPTVDHRFATLEMLLTNMAGPLVITVLVIFLARKRTERSEVVHGSLARPALAMALIGISGVLPLMLTMVQKSFYMAAALPALAIALALWSAPRVARLIGEIRPQALVWVRWSGISITLISVIVSVIVFGEPHRDKDILHDVDLIGSNVPSGALIGVPHNLWNDWNLQGYLMRFHFISLDQSEESAYFITAYSDQPPAGFIPVDLKTSQYRIWKRVTSASPQLPAPQPFR
ncbi:MAG: hypothetical protein M3R08_09535 [Bacteroidota bacterium]|nr:hypothetical protein [Bacteroidota bacterium]